MNIFLVLLLLVSDFIVGGAAAMYAYTLFGFWASAVLTLAYVALNLYVAGILEEEL